MLMMQEENRSSKIKSSFGISNVDELPDSMIRFSISNSVQAFPLLNEYLEGGRLSINHPLLPTAPTSKRRLMEGEIFNDSFINWMGGSATETV